MTLDDYISPNRCSFVPEAPVRYVRGDSDVDPELRHRAREALRNRYVEPGARERWLEALRTSARERSERRRKEKSRVAKQCRR